MNSVGKGSSPSVGKGLSLKDSMNPYRGLRNLILTVAALALFACFLSAAPSFMNGYWQRILNLIAINAILALSLNLIYSKRHFLFGILMHLFYRSHHLM